MPAVAQHERPLSVGVVEDSDEDFAVFSRVLSRHATHAEVTRWTRAEPLLAAIDSGASPMASPDAGVAFITNEPAASEATAPEVATALGVATAAGAVQGPEVDVLIVDLSLPGIDGCELTRRLRSTAATREIPIFILSGSARQRDIDRCYDAGADAYFRKSGSSEALSSLLDHVLAAAQGNWAPPHGGEVPGTARLCAPSEPKPTPARAWFGTWTAGARSPASGQSVGS